MSLAEAVLSLVAEAPDTPYRLFDVVLIHRQTLSPAFVRLTFAGPQVAAMTSHAPDQRIKIFFPDSAGEPAKLPQEGWLNAWKVQDPARRAPMRTYTIRALRPDVGEVDVDFVLHGDSGPASAWATRARPGSKVQMVAPNARFAGDPGGYEWRPPVDLADVLLIADETAVPALAGILDDLAARPRPPRTLAFAEVPNDRDALALAHWPGLSLTWMPREGRAPGSLMVDAAIQAAPARAGAGVAPPRVDVDRDILWDRATGASDGFYAWVAGEAMAVRDIRDLLIRDRGLDRRSLNLMGYWRQGRVLD